MQKQCPLTCDQVLVLVDIKLDAAQTLRSIRVYVLHMMDLFEPFVHLTKKLGTKSDPQSPILHPHIGLVVRLQAQAAENL